MDLKTLRDDVEAKHEAFLGAIREIEPRLTVFDWYRAISDGGRKNDDPQYDSALSESEKIRRNHRAWRDALHRYYRARDGENGFLGR